MTAFTAHHSPLSWILQKFKQNKKCPGFLGSQSRLETSHEWDRIMLLFLFRRPPYVARVLWRPQMKVYELTSSPNCLVRTMKETQTRFRMASYREGDVNNLHLKNKNWHWKQCFWYGKLRTLGKHACAIFSLENASSFCRGLLKLTGLSSVPGSRVTLPETFCL